MTADRLALIPARGGSRRVPRKNCEVEGCSTEVGRHGARGMCNKHYKRWKTHGTPNPSLPTREELFWRQVRQAANGCWEWTGGRHRAGYGQFGKGPKLAHRLAYEWLVGPIPTDTLDHLCRNRLCVNPLHLEPVTRGENVRRGVDVGKAWGDVQLAKTHCPQGHPYDEENTSYSSRGWRSCRACARIKARRRYAADRTHPRS